MTLRLDYDPYDPLPMLDSDDVGRYLDVEAEYMAAMGYARNRDAEKHRQRAVLLISEFSDCENFDPVIPYLAMNYFDRYISKMPILELSRDRLHDVDLIALSCLTIAWKMRDLKSKTREFLAKRPDLAEVSPLELVRTEIQILQGLKWRTRSLMAFCYLPHLEPKFNSTYGFSRRTLNQIIIQVQDGIGITNYRPSVIAASALLTACRYLYPDRYNSFFRLITSDPIFQRYLNHIELCVNGMIIMSNSLQLMIESALPEEETSQIRRVRAGQNPEGGSTSSTRVTNISSMEEYNGDSEFGFRLRWSVMNSNINKDDFVIFKDLPEAVADVEAEPVPATQPQPQPQPQPAQVAPQDEVGSPDGTPCKKMNRKMKYEKALDYDPYNPVPLNNGPPVGPFPMPAQGYWEKNKSNREFAIKIIYEVWRFENFSPLTAYLALHYFDQFMCKYPIPMLMSSGHRHDLQLLIVCCISLAWKLTKRSQIKSLRFLKKLINGGKITNKDITLMEMQIVEKLKWDLRVTTPFAFLPHLEGHFKVISDFNRKTMNNIIVHSQKTDMVVRYSPPVVAAATYLNLSMNVHQKRFLRFKEKIMWNIKFVKWEEAFRCMQALNDEIKHPRMETGDGDFDFQLKWMQE